MNTLSEFLCSNPFCRSLSLSDGDLANIAHVVEKEFFFPLISSIISETEEILAIDPQLDRREILEHAARHIVRNLGAQAASIRLFDPKSFRMLTYGSFGLDDYMRDEAVPASKSIAGKVVWENRTVVVPSILKNPLYQAKKITAVKGLHSLMAVPLRIPSFIDESRDILGSLQIYYPEDDRHFSDLEIIRAEMLARRVSHVLARKKILDLKRLVDYQNRIVDKIFIKLSKREGVKLKDFFHVVMAELDEFLHTKSCSLFTVSDDGKRIRLEAAYPFHKTYHGTGYSFTISHHKYFETAVYGSPEHGDKPYERFDEAYLLIKDPIKSELTTPGIRKFVEENTIHSILLVPMRIDATVRHVLAIYATDQKLYFNEEEIELFTFLGKEIMKASKLEFLSDMLHDFKNPAIAVAGLAARARKLLDKGDGEGQREKLASYLDAVAKETARLQELALTMAGEERKIVVDLASTAAERFALNKEVIRSERLKIESTIDVGAERLPVHCSPFSLARVMDNLLHNATKAVPHEGGILSLRCFRDSSMACIEVKNTGVIPAEHLDLLRRGEGSGRGLNIISRFVEINHGSLHIQTREDLTIIEVRLPLMDQSGKV